MNFEPCSTCGFDLWNPLWESEIVQVGFYDDARFPGRVIVMLKPHFDHLDQVPKDLASEFLLEVQRLCGVLRCLLAVERINMAILGNEVAHVHAHLIPRRRTDDQPGKAPWEDRRPRDVLEANQAVELVAMLRRGLWATIPTA